MGRFGQWDNGPLSFDANGEMMDAGASNPVPPSANTQAYQPFTANAVQGGGVLPDSAAPAISTEGTGDDVGGAGLSGEDYPGGTTDPINVGGISYDSAKLRNMTQGVSGTADTSNLRNNGGGMGSSTPWGNVNISGGARTQPYTNMGAGGASRDSGNSGYYFDDGGEVPDPAEQDPMQIIMEALRVGRQKMGMPESFYGDTQQDATASYDDGGVIQPDVTGGGNAPEAPLPDPRNTVLYLTGNGAMPPDQAAAIEQHVDPQGQMSPAERTLAAIASAPNPQSAFKLLQANRIHYNAQSGAARASLDKGDLGRAAAHATQAMAKVPTGYDVRFAPARGGVAVMGKRIGGPARPVQSMQGGGEMQGVIDEGPYNENLGEDTSDQPTVITPQQFQQVMSEAPDKYIEAATGDVGRNFTRWLSKMLGVQDTHPAEEEGMLPEPPEAPPLPTQPAQPRTEGPSPVQRVKDWMSSSPGLQERRQQQNAAGGSIDSTLSGIGSEALRQVSQDPVVRAAKYMFGAPAATAQPSEPSGQGVIPDKVSDPQLDMNAEDPEGALLSQQPAQQPVRPSGVENIPTSSGYPRNARNLADEQQRWAARAPQRSPEGPQPSAQTLRRGWETQDPGVNSKRIRYDKDGLPMDLMQGSNGEWRIGGTNRRREPGSQTLPTESPGFKRPEPDEHERTAQRIWPSTADAAKRQAYIARMKEHELVNKGGVEKEVAKGREETARIRADAASKKADADREERAREANARIGARKEEGERKSKEEELKRKFLANTNLQKEVYKHIDTGVRLGKDPETLLTEVSKLMNVSPAEARTILQGGPGEAKRSVFPGDNDTIKVYNGKRYRRGPNGEAIEVK